MKNPGARGTQFLLHFNWKHRITYSATFFLPLSVVTWYNSIRESRARNVRWNYYVFAMQNTLGTMNKDTWSSRHWLPRHEVEGKRSAFFNFPHRSIARCLRINSPETVKYARNTPKVVARRGNSATSELRNYRRYACITERKTRLNSAFMHIREIK